MIKFLLFTVLFLFNFLSYAQDLHDLKGEIKFTNDTNIVKGNVLLLSVKDSSLIKSIYLENGKFEFNQISQNEVLMKISLFEYPDVDSLILVNLNSLKTNLGIINIKPKTKNLNEVTIYSKVPIFEAKPNGVLVVNVNNSILTASTSVIDLLAKTPNVYIDEGGVSVIGKGSAIIYLNNKRIIASQLASIQVSQIKKIEVITNPSARYDSDGKAVINIITFKSQTEGFQGNVVQNTTLAKHLLSNTTVNINWKKKKWLSVLNYGQDLGTNWETNKLRRVVNSSFGNTTSENNFEDNSKVKYVSNYLFGIGYEKDSVSNLTLEYMGDSHLNDQNSQASTSFSSLNNNMTNIFTKTSGG